MKADARSREEPVTVRAFASKHRVAPGETFTVTVKMEIDKGYHINSNRPLQDYLIPTAITLRDGAEASLDEIAYPEGKQIAFGKNAMTLSVYEGELSFEAPVTVGAKAEPGPTTLALEVSLQPCSDTVCLPPQKHALRVGVEVVR